MSIGVSRRHVIGGLFVLVSLVILARLFHIQILSPKYKLSADNNVIRRIPQYPARGIIYDRNGVLVVYNEAAYDLLVTPSQLGPFDTLEFLSLVGISREQLEQGIQSARAYSRYKASPLVKQLSGSQFGRLQEHLHKFPGITHQARTLRHYPRAIAAHILGYVGEVSDRMIFENPYYKQGDYIGISGLERSYEEYLRGERGVENLMVDVHNRVIGPYAGGRYDTVPVAGADLYLSLDSDLQAYGERLMGGRRGGIVALDPSNGEILAMVSSPSYDPNLLVGRDRTEYFPVLNGDSLKPLFNRTIMALYPPGSTFKLVNGLLGLSDGVFRPDLGYTCYGRYTAGRGVGCHAHPHAGSLSAAVRMSCNAYFCHTFRRFLDRPGEGVESGLARWETGVRGFGFGQALGVDLPGELGGIVPTVGFYNKFFRKGGWNSLTLISLAIGQGELAATPLQMANLAAVIANRGHYYTPGVVRELRGRGLERISHARRESGIDSQHFAPVVAGMYEAVNGDWSLGGTGWRARVPGLSVCGKTGTAQNPHGDDHSVFIAFAPRDNPRIAISVYVENAGPGGRWAAPIAGLMIEKYLRGEVTNTVMEQYVLGVPVVPARRVARDTARGDTLRAMPRRAPMGLDSLQLGGSEL